VRRRGRRRERSSLPTRRTSGTKLTKLLKPSDLRKRRRKPKRSCKRLPKLTQRHLLTTVTKRVRRKKRMELKNSTSKNLMPNLTTRTLQLIFHPKLLTTSTTISILRRTRLILRSDDIL